VNLINRGDSTPFTISEKIPLKGAATTPSSAPTTTAVTTATANQTEAIDEDAWNPKTIYCKLPELDSETGNKGDLYGIKIKVKSSNGS